MAEDSSLGDGVEYEARLEAEVFTLSTESETSLASRYWVPDAHSEDVVEHTITVNNSKQIVDAAMQTMDCSTAVLELRLPLSYYMPKLKLMNQLRDKCCF